MIARFFNVILALGLIFQTSCSSDSPQDNDPQVLLQEAEENIEGSRYLLAIDQLKSLKNQHPYSDEAVKASLRLADVYFLQENFIEAAAQYETFKDLHPKHSLTEYATFRTGLSRYREAPEKLQRDLTGLSKAESDFREYLDRYPNGTYKSEALEKLKDSREKLARKHLLIANWYRKQKMYEAARGRYQRILSDYSDTSLVSEAESSYKSIEGKVDP